MPLPTLLALVILPSSWLLERSGRLPAPAKAWAARLLIQLIYPCLILGSLPLSIQQNELLALWPLPLATAILLLLGRSVGRHALPYSQLQDEGQRRSFVFAAILPNYSYVPLLVAQALWGDRGMVLVMLSSVGADLILWTLAVSELSWQGRFDVKRLVNPPLISLVLSLFLISSAGATLRAAAASFFPWFKLVGTITIPLSMFLLGVHLARRTASLNDGRAQWLLLVWRLILAPALMLLALRTALPPLPVPAGAILLLVASMPGAIVTVVLAEVYGASPDLAARHVFWGHLAWLVTGSFWLWLSTFTL